MTNQQQGAPAQKRRSLDKPQQRPEPRVPQSPTAPTTRSVGRELPDSRTVTSLKQAPSVKVEDATVTAGAAGATNLNVDWIDVWIGNAKPCRFDVRTLPGHGLEVQVSQLEYRRTYTGTGAISTQPVPIVPIGTRFTVISKDTTTGEILEQKGIWYNMGGGGSIWELIKRLLFKS